jgi:hypothetical protein
MDVTLFLVRRGCNEFAGFGSLRFAIPRLTERHRR